MNSEKNRYFVHFKKHILLHLSNIFYEILDLGPPINAQAHYKSSIFKYNVASTIQRLWWSQIKRSIFGALNKWLKRE